MSNLKTILSATATILRVIGNGYNAYGKFYEGKNLEGWKNTFQSASALNDGWDDIQKSWTILNGNSFGVDLNRGVYSGTWIGKEGNSTLKHNSSTSISTFSAVRNDGKGYNTYNGSYNSNYNQFVWVGYNSQNVELTLIGTPNNDNSVLFIDLFVRNNNEDLKYSNSLIYFPS